MLAESDSIAVSDTGAGPNLVCFSLLQPHNRILRREESPRVSTQLASARFRSGDGGLGEGRRAADTPVGIAGNKGEFAAFALEADIPALLRKGALEARGGRLDFSRDISTLRNHRGRHFSESESDGVLYSERCRF